jgi:hypothetical protein
MTMRGYQSENKDRSQWQSGEREIKGRGVEDVLQPCGLGKKYILRTLRKYKIWQPGNLATWTRILRHGGGGRSRRWMFGVVGAVGDPASSLCLVPIAFQPPVPALNRGFHVSVSGIAPPLARQPQNTLAGTTQQLHDLPQPTTGLHGAYLRFLFFSSPATIDPQVFSAHPDTICKVVAKTLDEHVTAVSILYSETCLIPLLTNGHSFMEFGPCSEQKLVPQPPERSTRDPCGL